MAQVLGHQAVALDDGEPEEEPATVGRATTTRKLDGTNDGHVGRGPFGDGARRSVGVGTGTGTGHVEPPGLVAGRHAGDGGQDGPEALGAVELGAGHDPGAVHDTAPGESAGRAVHAAGAGGEQAEVHAGPDPVSGGGGGGPEHVAGLVPQQRAAAVVGRRRQPSGRPAGQRREPDTRAEHRDHHEHGGGEPAEQRHTRRHVAHTATDDAQPDPATDVPAHPAVRPRPVPVHRRHQRRPHAVFVVQQRRHVGRVHGVQSDRVHQQRGLRRRRRRRQRHETRLHSGHRQGVQTGQVLQGEGKCGSGLEDQRRD